MSTDNIAQQLRLDNPRRLTYEQIEEAFVQAADGLEAKDTEIERLRAELDVATLNCRTPRCGNWKR